MQQKKNKYSYISQSIKKGSIQIALPGSNLYMIRPSVVGAAVQYQYAVAPINNNDTGYFNIKALMPGTQVYYSLHNQQDSKNFIICEVPTQRGLYDAYKNYRHIYYNPSDLEMLETARIEDLYKHTLYKETGQPFIITQKRAFPEILPGDYLIQDSVGNGIRIGRSLTTITASPLSYTQYSGYTNRITNVAQTFETNTLTSRVQISSGVDKVLKAFTFLQSIGNVQGNPLQYSIKEYANTQYLHIHTDSLKQKKPIYRYQRFTGSQLVGETTIVLKPIKDQKVFKSCTVYQHSISREGFSSLISGSGIRSIKSISNKGIIQNQINKEDLQNTDKQVKQLLEKKEILSDVSLNSIKSLIIDSLLKTPISQLLRDVLYNKQTLQQLNQQDITLGTALCEIIRSKQNQPLDAKQITQQIPNPFIQDMNNNIYYSNNSFISQQKDGSIFIKDGWGSQIRMTGGNIYISSALDTFILPGRDIIQLVPRNKNVTSNKQIVLVSSKKSLIGSQGDTVITSALSGGSGFTTIQNKASKAHQNSAGIILRSNSDTLITASRDLYIGLNDKTQSNAKDKITKGTGNIHIEGYNISIDSIKALKATAQTIGLYGYTGNTGAGIQLQSSRASLISPNIQLASGNVQIGVTNSICQAYIGSTDKLISIQQGIPGSANIKIDGYINTRGINIAGALLVTGQIIGDSYSIMNPVPQQTIMGIKKESADRIRTSIYNTFAKSMEGTSALKNLKIQVPWYNDDYICSHQSHFKSSYQMQLSSAFVLPKMCWQENPLKNTQIFNFISTKATGQNSYSYSYPGKEAVQSGKILSWDSYNREKDTSEILKNNYITNTYKEIQE